MIVKKSIYLWCVWQSKSIFSVVLQSEFSSRCVLTYLCWSTCHVTLYLCVYFKMMMYLRERRLRSITDRIYDLSCLKSAFKHNKKAPQITTRTGRSVSKIMRELWKHCRTHSSSSTIDRPKSCRPKLATSNLHSNQSFKSAHLNNGAQVGQETVGRASPLNELTDEVRQAVEDRNLCTMDGQVLGEWEYVCLCVSASSTPQPH